MKKAIWVSVLAMTLALMIPTFAQPAFAQPAETWVMMHGMINSYGGVPATYGMTWAYAKIGEWANAYAFWIPLSLGPTFGGLNITFTYSFYAARLVNASVVELNYTGYDFYISGIWDVNKLTFEYINGNFSKTIEVVVDDAPGELSVTSNWQVFTISITGIELLSGTVMFYHVTSVGPIPIGDITGPIGQIDHRVDIYDLVEVAQAYGSTPGNPSMPGFDFSIDLNFDFTVDIYDLTTLAANLGEEY